MQFQELQLIDPLLRALQAEGYTIPTPIQEQAIPPVMNGRDLIGCAQTGTGKTAAFALPILQRLSAVTPKRGSKRAIRALVLSPTRELASQIADSFSAYGRHLDLKHAVVFGGVGQNPQVQLIRRGVDIVIATPGRLLDLMGQGEVRFDALEVFVLDEADRMLDMGFIHDVRRIIKELPRKRQTLLFSATMPDAIQELASSILTNPAYVEVTPQATTVEKIDQTVFMVDKNNKRALLEHMLRDANMSRVLVFTRTKHGANKLAQQLVEQARIPADAIHGNKSQSAREKALASFKSGRIRVLVATDIAARGIDVDDVTHVINFDLPNESESYVHRIGRTARAGASGIAISFCDAEERSYLRDIERLIRRPIPVVSEHPYPALIHSASRPARNNGNSARQQQSRAGQNSNNRGGRPSSNGGGSSNQSDSSYSDREQANKRRRRRSQPMRENYGN